MAYTLDRAEAARRLGVSSRTIDRYIRADRLRTRRIGKKIFLEEEDVEAIRMADSSRRNDDYIVVTDTSKNTSSGVDDETVALKKTEETMTTMTQMIRLYEDSQSIIAKKDDTIQDLAYKLGKAETELANSIPALEYKKATFMLESIKTKNTTDLDSLGSKITKLEGEINKRNSAIITLVILFLLVLAFAVIFILFGDAIIG